MRQRPPDPEDRLEMTPMIDVTFLLLIFFIVTLNFRTLEGRLDATMPKVQGVNEDFVEPIEKLDIVLRVLQEGVLVPDPEAEHLKLYSGRRVGYSAGAQRFTSLDGLAAFLAELPKDTPVTIDARQAIVYGDVAPVLDQVIAAGFESIAFAASHEDS